MRRIVFFASFILLPGLLFTSFVGAADARKESVTIEIDADLLKRARAQDLDLASILEKQLKARLGSAASAPATDHLSFLSAAFDNFESIMFAPLKVNAQTSNADVRKVCKEMIKGTEQLIADAETRKSMPLPTSLEEARKLDDYIQSRFKAFQERAAKVGQQAANSSQILKSKCADLDVDETQMRTAMQSVFAGYGPAGWCQAMRQKAQAEWTMEDSENFVKFCTGG
jgi:Protein of unknown function (DUF3012)